MKSLSRINGKAKFHFQIERYLVGDQYFVDSPNEEGSGYTEVTLDISGWYYSYPAKIHGDPLDCYPADSDYEITSIIGPNNEDWYDKVTKSELERIIDSLIEKVSSNDDYDF